MEGDFKKTFLSSSSSHLFSLSIYYLVCLSAFLWKKKCEIKPTNFSSFFKGLFPPIAGATGGGAAGSMIGVGVGVGGGGAISLTTLVKAERATNELYGDKKQEQWHHHHHQ